MNRSRTSRQLEERVRREVDDGLVARLRSGPSASTARSFGQGHLGDADIDTRFTIFSATKALVASTVWTCLAEGSIKLDSLVADMIPEFATNGKEDITVEQVMLHTSGFPRNGWDVEMATSAGRRERFAKWKTNWEPGTRYEYHATTAHWVLAELHRSGDGQELPRRHRGARHGAVGPTPHPRRRPTTTTSPSWSTSARRCRPTNSRPSSACANSRRRK